MFRTFRTFRAVRHAPVLASPSHRASHAFLSHLAPVNKIRSTLQELDVDNFRDQAFKPELPLLITDDSAPAAGEAASKSMFSACGVPAVKRWFESRKEADVNGGSRILYGLQKQYLMPFKDVMVPIEMISYSDQPSTGHAVNPLQIFREELKRQGETDLSSYLPELPEVCAAQVEAFHSFYGPLGLFLFAVQGGPLTDEHETNGRRASGPHKLYIAQAKIADLPAQLQKDFPTPRIVLEAGKGDIYDANIWVGVPPTYTPLHRDPNPNLFLQLAGDKAIRLFRPDVGRAIFNAVQAEIGGYASPVFRGEEMMQGPERKLLEEAVWQNPPDDGYEVVVKPGNALFIPRGWWHSIKSSSQDEVNGSVNWWFR
ncbi:MAG: hypothetical protein M1818_004401 [Claussenomyces sp. TS43310]|nr:MAG: hypothetical protein M1818_004401 [Claussenomyces sp. TS43310]